MKQNFVGYVVEKSLIYIISGKYSYLFVFINVIWFNFSPSGCTFWGKKQWSRKKVILWQVATLIGAPVIIALIAGVAVPGVIIGVPVWAGRKIFKKFNKSQYSKTKRNILVTLGVTGSVLASPIIATLAVGIGVPILLAYVYGVSDRF